MHALDCLNSRWLGPQVVQAFNNEQKAKEEARAVDAVTKAAYSIG